MSATAASFAPEVLPKERVTVLFGELAESTGQHNAIDGRSSPTATSCAG